MDDNNIIIKFFIDKSLISAKIITQKPKYNFSSLNPIYIQQIFLILFDPKYQDFNYKIIENFDNPDFYSPVSYGDIMKNISKNKNYSFEQFNSDMNTLFKYLKSFNRFKKTLHNLIFLELFYQNLLNNLSINETIDIERSIPNEYEIIGTEITLINKRYRLITIIEIITSNRFDASLLPLDVSISNLKESQLKDIQLVIHDEQDSSFPFFIPPFFINFSEQDEINIDK